LSGIKDDATATAATVTAVLNASIAGVVAAVVLAGVTPTFAVSGSAASVSEGSSVIFTLQTTNVAAGSSYSYVLSGVSAADVAGGSLTGTVTIGSDGKALIPVTLVADASTEGAETLTVTVAGKTASATVTDTSTTPAPTPLAAVLTIGADSGAAFTGTDANDTFTAADTTATTWTVGDVINGGLGNDTFNVIRAAAVTSVPTGASVSNIETVNITSGATVALNTTTGFSGMTALNTVGVGGATITGAATTALSVANEDAAAGNQAIAVNGGSSVAVTSTNNLGDVITVGATTAAAGAVTVNSSSTIAAANGDTAGTITVTGGTSVTVNQTAANQAATGVATIAGAVTVTGSAATTSVTVTDSASKAGLTAAGGLAGSIGHTNATVTIADANAATATTDTITTVTLRNYGASTIDSTVLNNLTLSGGTITASGALAINKTTADTTGTATVLALNMAGGKVGAITGTHAADFVTVNIDTSVASTIADITFAGMTTLNATGAARTVLTANTGVGALTTVTTGNGGFTMGTALADTVLYTGGGGADTIKIGSTTKAITLGAGNDSVTTSTGLVGTGGSVDAGAGTADKIIFTTTAHAVTAGSSSVFNTKFTGFEVVELSAALSGTVNVGAINNASSIILKAGGDNVGTAIIQDLVSGGTVTTEIAGTGFVVNIAGAGGGVNDILNLSLARTAQTTFTSMTAANTETINIRVADAQSTSSGLLLSSAAVVHSATLVATSAKTITVTGNNGLTLTNAGNVAVTLFDASGVVANDTAAFVTASGTLAAAVTDTAANLAVTYASVTTEGATTVGQTVTIKGGAGDDNLTGNTLKDVISGGAGADRIYSDNAGAKQVQQITITDVAGTAADTITIAGISTSFTGGADAAASTAAIVAAVNLNANLAGIAVASDSTGGVMRVTFLADGVQTAATLGGTGATGVVVLDGTGTSTAGTAGTAAVDTIDGGAGADVIVGGGGADVITTGLGADTVFMMKEHSNLNAMATITDFTFAVGGLSNDKLVLGNVVAAIGTVTTVQDFSAQASLALALDAAAAANTGVANGLSVFIFGGNEYVYVETTQANNTYTAGDFVVKLTGLPLAAGATIAGSGFDAV
jgi:S-layer protein